MVYHCTAILNRYAANAKLAFITCFPVSEVPRVHRGTETYFIHTFKYNERQFLFQRAHSLKRQDK